MAYTYIRTPFAENGDKTTIPNDNPPDNTVSYDQGFGPEYDLDPVTDPNAEDIERGNFNSLLNNTTGNIQFWQTRLFPDWVPAADNGGTPIQYGIGMVVNHNGLTWIAIENNTTQEPGVGGWFVFSASLLGITSRQEYTASGAHTFVPPAGIQALKVTLVGAGGGGGGANDVTGGGGGGGGGERVVAFYEGSAILASYDLTVGAGGAGGTGDLSGVGNAGADGSDTILRDTSDSSLVLFAEGGGGGEGSSAGQGDGGQGGTGGIADGTETRLLSFRGSHGHNGSSESYGTQKGVGGHGGNAAISGSQGSVGQNGSNFSNGSDNPSRGGGGGGGGGPGGTDPTTGIDGASGYALFEW